MDTVRGSAFMPPPRQPQVESALVTWAQSRLGRAHEWGVCDCFTVVQEAVSLQIKVPFPGVGVYASAASAVAAFQAALQAFGSAGNWLVAHGLYQLTRPVLAPSGAVLVWEAQSAGNPDALPHFGVKVGRHVLQCTAEKGVFLVHERMFVLDRSSTAYGVR